MRLEKLRGIILDVFKKAVEILPKIRLVESYVAFTRLTPAEHKTFDFSEPPPIEFYYKCVLDTEVPPHDWLGYVPDSSFDNMSILRGDLILFRNVPLASFQPEINSFVLVPPLGVQGINTGWGQIVRIIDLHEGNIIVIGAIGEEPRKIPSTSVMALAVGHVGARRAHTLQPSGIIYPHAYP